MNNIGTFGKVSPGEPSNWRLDPTTEKQRTALYNLGTALDWNYIIPKTKGEAADLLDSMMKEAQKRIALTGQIRPSKDFMDEPWEHWGDSDDDVGDFESEIF